MPNSGRDRKDQNAFLRSILSQAVEIAYDVDGCVSERDSSSDNTDGEEEEITSGQNQKQ
jgi:hypothetical protein